MSLSAVESFGAVLNLWTLDEVPKETLSSVSVGISWRHIPKWVLEVNMQKVEPLRNQ